VPWVKEGLVLTPGRQFRWMQTHAALPIVDVATRPPRLYFTSRDAEGRSHIGRSVLRLDDGARATDIEPDPVLSPGPLGAFDDAGVTGSCVVERNGRWFLFYTGWSLGVSVPFYLQAGLAVSDDGVTFTRVSAAPLFDRSAADPFLTASPWVLVDEGRWRMWYVSGTAWEVHDGKVRHRYLIKYAESDDGYAWRRAGQICLPYRDADEYAFGRPCVVCEGGRYRMWYSSRGVAYRLGYAESADGLHWERRDDEAGVDPSASGWDAEMVTYPVVFRHGGALLMLYNGNGYGASGIGAARLVARRAQA
jgi:predicted GH43/DUF377 family glycosyl hydrolase